MTTVTCPQCGARNRVNENAAGRPFCGKCHTPLALPAVGNGDGKPIIVTDQTFRHEVLNSSRPVVLDCWAPWCGPCRMIAPVINEIARESAGRYVVAKLNVDENPRVASEFRIDSIPTLLIFRHGRPVDRLVGLQSKQALQARLAHLN